MDRNRIIEEALSLRPDAIRRGLTAGIRAADPELYIVEPEASIREVRRFAAKGHCSVSETAGFPADSLLVARGDELHDTPEVGWWDLNWCGSSLQILTIHLSNRHFRQPFVLLMGKDPAAVRGFVIELTKFTTEVRGAVLVFQDGCWHFDEELYADIRTSTFANLVLPQGMADRIRDDIQHWLDSRDLYERHGIPWKRGMILVGPPGNGKTHMIKALANHFQLSTLYVRGFEQKYGSEAKNIEAVFEKARDCAPSMMILEDLDTLVNPKNRSYFLNELDGFARNTGILTIASANDPAKLDPALINRPSRFDRRYVFELPAAQERSRYLQFFSRSLEASLQLTDPEAAELGANTEGFSFAYLKELVLSSMMTWISDDKSRPFSSVIADHVTPLLAQMSLDPEPTPPRTFDADEDEDDD